ncbi:hypothetical protein PPS11_08570 [Pseudomonas putida S11]|nr:hypothetical protein PPS11_08570 [Pseudomonas putida S11]
MTAISNTRNCTANFQHALSVIDLLFNTGADAPAFLERRP